MKQIKQKQQFFFLIAVILLSMFSGINCYLDTKFSEIYWSKCQQQITDYFEYEQTANLLQKQTLKQFQKCLHYNSLQREKAKECQVKLLFEEAIVNQYADCYILSQNEYNNSRYSRKSCREEGQKCQNCLNDKSCITSERYSGIGQEPMPHLLEAMDINNKGIEDNCNVKPSEQCQKYQSNEIIYHDCKYYYIKQCFYEFFTQYFSQDPCYDKTICEMK